MEPNLERKNNKPKHYGLGVVVQSKCLDRKHIMVNYSYNIKSSIELFSDGKTSLESY